MTTIERRLAINLPENLVHACQLYFVFLFCSSPFVAVRIKLQWSHDPSTLHLDPLLVICAEGLSETEHPYAFAARECFRELLATDVTGEKSVPLVPRLVPCLRAGEPPSRSSFSCPFIQ